MQKKKILWIVIGVVAALLVAAVVMGAWHLLHPKAETPTPTDPTAEPGKAFTVEVIHGDGSKKTFQYRSEEEYLGTVLLAEGLISGDQGEYGLYIKVVDGEQAIYEEDNAYWGFFIGEEYASTGVDMTPITEGAVYKLVYTKG